LATRDRRLIDPGDGIPLNPLSQLPLLIETDNGWHPLDPPDEEQPSQVPYPFHKISVERLALQSVQMQFLNLAKSHLGYAEDSHGASIFGRWYGNQPEVMDHAFDTAPWCDMFLASLTSVLLGLAGLELIGDYALTTAHASFLHKKGVTSRPDTFLSGAFIFQNWDLNGTGNGDLAKIDHVELVEKDNGNGTVTTVGGNVDNGVRRRIRSKAYCVVIAEWWKLLPENAAIELDDWYAVPGGRA
jgi:hypothetical protein